MTVSWDYGRDHVRPLSSRGISDAKKIGLYLNRKNELPDLLISSTALRAKTTAEMAMIAGKWPCTLELDEGIYSGDLKYLLKLINKQNNSYSSICLVGHEPNISNFIARLTGDVHTHFSKGSMAKIDFDVNNWVDIYMGFGRLIWRIEPNDI
jgi:phosphohistidine phosphatase